MCSRLKEKEQRKQKIRNVRTSSNSPHGVVIKAKFWKAKWLASNPVCCQSTPNASPLHAARDHESLVAP